MRHAPVLIFACLSISVGAQDRACPARFAPLRRAIQKAIDDSVSPAVSIAVLEGGELVWAEGFGLADIARKQKATADTIYRLASISKPFTATALMMLVERGKVSLDDPVNQHLEAPGVIARRGKASQITLRRLANHTAGLPTHWSFFYGDHRPPPRSETIRRYGFAAWPPGTRANYSNLAFGILDHVIARVSGHTYRDFLVTELLDPLGMKHTDVGIRPDRDAVAAVAYARQGDRFVPVTDYGFDHDGASAVRSSARDLITFARLHIGEGETGGVRILAKASALAMRQQRGRNAGSRFGVGWSVGSKKGARMLSHTGGMPGVSTALEVFPGQQSAVAILSNTAARSFVSLTMKRATAIVLRDARTEQLPLLGTPGPRPAGPTRHRSSPAGRYIGKVLHPNGPIPIEITLKKDRTVHLRLGKTEITEFANSHIRKHALRLRFRAPLRTTKSLRTMPQLQLELDRTAKTARDGWQGLLYASGSATLRLPHWVTLERAKE